MVRVLFIFLCLFEFLFGLSLTQEEENWLKEHPVLNVGYSTNFEPLYIQNDNGSIEGVLPDFYEIVASKLNIKINFKINNSKETLENITSRNIDVVPMMLQKTANDDGLLLTNKIYSHAFKIYGKSNTATINSMNDLKGLRIAYVKEIASLEQYLQKYKNTATLIASENTFDAFQKVLNNQADIAIVLNFNGSYVIKKNLITELRPLYMITDLNLASISAVHTNNKILHSLLNKAYDSISQDEKAKIFRKWFAPTEEHEKLVSQVNSKDKQLLKNINFNVYVGEWEPFMISNDNVTSGISIELWELLASKFNLQYSYIKTKNFNETLQSMKDDKNGIVISTTATKDKEEFAAFSKTIMSFPVAVATNINENFIIDLKELEGRRIAVGKNYSAHFLLKEHYPKIEFVLVENTLEALHLLNKGEVYGAADILPVLIYTMNKYNLSRLKISGTSTFLFDIKMMFNKYNQNIIPIMNTFINALDEADTQLIVNKWIYTKEIEKINYTYVYIVGLLSLCVIVILIFRQKILDANKQAIEKERYKYQSLMNYSSDMIFIIDFDGNLLEYSKQVQALLGYTNDEMRTLCVFDWDKSLTQDQYKQMCALLTSHTPLQLQREHTKKDNTIYIADIQAVKVVIETEEYVYATVRDVTQVKELEQEVIKEKDFISTIIDNANAIIAVINNEGRMIKVNKYAQEFTQYSQEEISSVPYFWTRFLPLQMQDAIEEIIEKAKQGEIVKFFKNSWISKSGEERVFEWSNTLVMKPDGTMDYIATIGIDVTQKELIQKQILEQKEEFESIFKYSSDGIAITDLETNFLDFNDAYLKITLFTREELLKISSLELSAPEHKEKMKELISTAIKEGHIENYEKESIVNEGKRILVNMSISLLPDKKRLLIVTKDVTSLKLLEDQSRLAAMGEMIGNIAHQWRQPLSVITTAISGASIKKELGLLDEKDFQDTRDIIIKQANYLSMTIENFRNFIKEDKKVALNSMKNILENTVSLVTASLENNFIKVVLNIKEDGLILGNKNELTEAFINIINNSKDILKERNIAEENRFIFIKTKKIDDNHLEVKFLDTGGGIDEKIMSRILEPYFTTKHKSQGTGLGLSIADKIIRQRHYGNIKIFNESFEFNGNRYAGFCFSIIFKSTQKEYH